MTVVTLLTDFGTVDHYSGVMKGVVLSVDPRIAVVDLGHDIPPGDVQSAAFTLLAAYRYFPAGTVHVAVIDPGVGTERRVIAIEAADQRFVGPDNGLFSYLLERETDARIVDVTNRRYFREPVSTTFHGRDIFAPVGAALARGVQLDDLGPAIRDPVSLPPLRPARGDDGVLLGRIVHVDRFGNCITSVSAEDLAPRAAGIRIRVGSVEVTTLRRHYSGAQEAEPFAVWGSSGFLELSVNGGSAAASLQIGRGDPVEIEGLEEASEAPAS